MKGTKQRNTAGKRRLLCHQAGRLIPNTLKFGKGGAGHTIQKWVAIIETIGHKSTWKFQYTDEAKDECAADPAYGKSMSCKLLYIASGRWHFDKYYSEILSRFFWVSFDTEKLNRKHREIFAPLSMVPDKKEFTFIWLQFPCIRRHPWQDRGQTWLKTIQCVSAPLFDLLLSVLALPFAVSSQDWPWIFKIIDLESS